MMGFDLVFSYLLLTVEQALGIVMQDAGLLGVGETEVGDGAGGGQRVVERVITAEDDPVGADLSKHPGELLRQRAASQHRARDRDVDPDISLPPGIAADYVVDQELREAGAVRVRENQLRVG